MNDSDARPRLLRFGVFEVDLRTAELRKQGLKVKLHGQPFQILAMLLERPGEPVTREEIREKLWPEDTFVDFEHSINAAVKRLREALGDDTERPRYIETLPRRGYRFIGPVEAAAPVPSPVVPGAAVSPPPAETALPDKVEVGAGYRQNWRRLAMVGAVLVAVAAALFALNVAGLRGRLLTAMGARRSLPLPKIESIAVLPLENLSGDPQQEYFADGMTEELITNLGKISALRVISRTSVMRYKGTKKPLPEIARELNVDVIVEGTVLRSGNRVRVTANLLDANADRHLWAETYERNLRDVLSLQSEVARAITNEIQIKVTPQEQARLASARSVNPEAYQLYLKGRYYAGRGTKEGLEMGVQYFNQAIAADPSYALAYDGLADDYWLADEWTLSPRDAIPKAKEAAKKALELDDTLAEAHASLAVVNAFYDWDWAAAESEFKRSIELKPNYALAHELYGWYLALIGRTNEGIAESERSVELDPLSPEANSYLGYVLWVAHRNLQAIEQLRKTTDLDPNYWFAYEVLGLAYERQGQFPEAIAELQKAVRLAGIIAEPTVGLARVYAVSGNRAEAQKLLETLKERSKETYVSPYLIAMICARLGERDQALAWLERAYQARSMFMIGLKLDPSFDSLRSDPRFQDLLRRMNFSL
jgi:TolB-like protein/DNA-binding winged helix-turn-helix (wHTH) protein/Tfp pilus assembly protein PilF